MSKIFPFFLNLTCEGELIFSSSEQKQVDFLKNIGK